MNDYQEQIDALRKSVEGLNASLKAQNNDINQIDLQIQQSGIPGGDVILAIKSQVDKVQDAVNAINGLNTNMQKSINDLEKQIGPLRDQSNQILRIIQSG